MSTKLYPGRCYLWMPLGVPWRAVGKQHCCQAMNAALEFDCTQHKTPWECADSLLLYNEVFDEYGLVMRDGTTAYVVISHCPWCAAALPESARERWIKVVEGLGFDPAGDVPAAFRTSSWRIS